MGLFQTGSVFRVKAISKIKKMNLAWFYAMLILEPHPGRTGAGTSSVVSILGPTGQIFFFFLRLQIQHPGRAIDLGQGNLGPIGG
jgi:hypothetical protein